MDIHKEYMRSQRSINGANETNVINFDKLPLDVFCLDKGLDRIKKHSPTFASLNSPPPFEL